MRELLEKLEKHAAIEAANPSIMAQRAMVMVEMQGILLSSPKDVLVINNGLGEDALMWAEYGHRVCLVEPDIEKLKITRLFSAFEKVADRIEFHQGSVQWLVKEDFSRSFDVLYAGFGVMNSLTPEELQNCAHNSHALLRPGGKFISLVQPDCCPWERMHYLFRGKRELSRRREQGAGLSVNAAGEMEATYYYNPEVFIAFFEDYFRFEYKSPIGVFTPPQHLGNQYRIRPKWASQMMRFDKWASKWKSFSACCDHYLMILSNQ